MSHRTNLSYLFLLLNFFVESLSQVTFSRLTNRSYFIDKTNLIEEFFKNNDTNLMICANRKYGKSVNLNMLKQFVQLEVNKTTGIPLNKTESWEYRLFTNTTLNLTISQNKDLIETHLGEYPTIFLDFASRKANYTLATFDHMLDLVRSDISDSFKSYGWLCRELEKRHGDEQNTTKQAQIQLMKNAIAKTLTTEQMRMSIYNLSEILTEYFDNKTVMVLVDENVKLPDDFSNMNQKSKSLASVNELIATILHNLMKPYSNSTHLAKVFITSMSRSGIDAYKNSFLRKNVKVYPFLREHAFNSFYGFNETETNKLCNRLNITDVQRKGLNEVYMGESYPTGKTRVKIYNPFLVMKFLQNIIKPIKTNKTRRIHDYVNLEIEKWLGNDVSF